MTTSTVTLSSTECKITLKNVRLSFPKLDKPVKFQENSDPRYGANFIVDKTPENIKALQQVMRDAVSKTVAASKVDDYIQSVNSSKKTSIADCEVIGMTDFPDCWVVKAFTGENSPPMLLNGDRSRIDPTKVASTLYAGCYVNAIVSVYTSPPKFGNRLCVGLSAIQFAKAGERLGGISVSVDDFDLIESDTNFTFGEEDPQTNLKDDIF